jgi:hypothetical protein
MEKNARSTLVTNLTRMRYSIWKLDRRAARWFTLRAGVLGMPETKRRPIAEPPFLASKVDLLISSLIGLHIH